MRIGYAQASTDDQSLDLQLDALQHVSCSEIYRDYGISGATVKRPALRQVLGALKPGDTLVCWRLDRLGRRLSHLIAVISGLEHRSIGFVFLTEAIDNQTASGRLLFHIMRALAEFERALISERTRAGMAAARARGARVGRPEKLSAEQLARAAEVLRPRQETLQALSRRSGVSIGTVARRNSRSGMVSCSRVRGALWSDLQTSDEIPNRCSERRADVSVGLR